MLSVTLKILKRLSEERKNKIKEVITTLKSDPIPFRKFDVAKLKGYENTYSVRIGNLRIVYEVTGTEKELIHLIGQEKKPISDGFQP